jgi:hypothetical protein
MNQQKDYNFLWILHVRFELKKLVETKTNGLNLGWWNRGRGIDNVELHSMTSKLFYSY